MDPGCPVGSRTTLMLMLMLMLMLTRRVQVF